MNHNGKSPSASGQLVWCPSDPGLGVGLVTEQDGHLVKVKFLRLSEERHYTLRTADRPILRYEIANGERVTYQGSQQVRVRRRLAGGLLQSEHLFAYELENGDQVTENHLVPHVRDVGAKERLASLTLSHPEVVRARISGLSLADFGQRPGLCAVLGARAAWLPHQVDIAARALNQDPIRLLLADEVGLGKTVEAALILAGLKHEGRANRVLVLTPEALTIQWLQEIYRKTHELYVLMDAQRLSDAQRDFPGLNPFEAHQHMVASLERVCGDPRLAAAAELAQWDLIIVDEAHHLRWQAKRGGNPAYRLVEALAQKTRNLLLLTATPMALDPTEYHVLLRLLDPERFDDPRMFDSVADRARVLRDAARALQDCSAQGKALPVKLRKQLKDLLADDGDDLAVLAALDARGLAKKEDTSALVAQLMEALRQRHSLSDYVTRNRRGPVGGLPKRHAEVFALTPTEAQEQLIDVGESVMVELAMAINDSHERQRMVGELLRALWASPSALLDIVRPYSKDLAKELAPLVAQVVDAPLDAKGLPTGDSRLAWLVARIRQLAPGEKLLVFVESAFSVRALFDALGPLLGAPVALFHRDLGPRDQDRQVAYFRDPQGASVMLSTEAGGEGRNFQFCHNVVLYDMPWRPATVEQRIGRVDRVGQKHDVHVLVPYFSQGYEAAIVKVMQQAIGILDRTVGGIDHALENVSHRLGELVIQGAGAEAWKGLYRDVAGIVKDARERIEADIDPILDHASFSPERARKVLARVPADLEVRTEAFLQGYAEHTRLSMHSRGASRVAVEGAISSTGSSDDSGYVATFSRTDALDHEDIEFLSFGHPLVEQALSWASHAHEASASLALCRNWHHDGAAFLWTFGVHVSEDAPEALTYLPTTLWTHAVDEEGTPRPELDGLMMEQDRRLDRMDPTPLRSSIERWRALVERNFEQVEKLAVQKLKESCNDALARLDEVMEVKHRHLRRQAMRQLAQVGEDKPQKEALLNKQEMLFAAHQKEHDRLTRALNEAQPHLTCAVAVRFMKSKTVSA